MSISRHIAALIISGKTTLSLVIELLTKYKMLSLMPSIKQSLMQMSSQVNAQDTIMIESPFPLSDVAVKHVKGIVGNNDAMYEISINKNVLAGFKARFRGMLYDGSAERIIKQVLESN